MATAKTRTSSQSKKFEWLTFKGVEKLLGFEINWKGV